MRTLCAKIHLQQLEDRDWVEILSKNANHSVFTCLDWFRAWQETAAPGKYERLLIRCDTDSDTVIIPCMLVRLPFGQRAILSSPASGTPTIFSNQPISELAFKEIIRAIRNEFRCAIIRFNISPIPKSTIESTKSTPRVTTHLLDLTSGYDAIFKNYKHKVRKNLAAAERNNVSVSLGKKSDLVEFYRLIKLLHVNRFGYVRVKVPPLSLYERLLDLSIAEIIIVREGNTSRILAATVCLRNKFEYFQWHSASDYTAPDLRPNDCWEDFAIRRAIECGCSFLNFGSSPSEGVARFKESFGAKQSEYAVFEDAAALASLFLKVRRWRP